MGRLDGKIVLVTGGAKGQGPMHARLCAREGADVILVDILDEAGEATAESIRGEGHKARYFHLDITRADDWQEVLDTVAAEHGPVNGLVNNAAVLVRKPIEEIDEAEWDRTLEVNAKGVFLGIKHSLFYMRKAGGGSIVNISSVAGIRASFVADAAYSSSKGAVVALTKTIAVQYARENIRCNCILPAHIDTDMLHVAHPTPERFNAVADHVPLGRIGTLEEVSHAVVYLVSDESGFMTGADLVIDGGMAARY